MNKGQNKSNSLKLALTAYNGKVTLLPIKMVVLRAAKAPGK